VWLNERVVDGNNVNAVMLNSISEDDTADTTETVDSDLDWCHVDSWMNGWIRYWFTYVQMIRPFLW